MISLNMFMHKKKWLGKQPLLLLSELFDSYDPEVGFGGIHGRGRRKQDPPIERELYLTLEEVYKGCVKKMKISRRVRNKSVGQYLLVREGAKYHFKKIL